MPQFIGSLLFSLQSDRQTLVIMEMHRTLLQRRLVFPHGILLLVGLVMLAGACPGMTWGQDDLPKLEDMEVPSSQTLLKAKRVAWVVLHNDTVIVTEPVYPRPDTLAKMESAFQASFKWPRARNPADLEEQKRKRNELNYLSIVIPAEDVVEYQLHRKEVAEVIHHEDLVLRRVDQLTKDGRLRDAFEMLFLLEQATPDWPGAQVRQENLLYRDAEIKREGNRLETALVLLEELHLRNPEFVNLPELMGQVTDQLLERATQAKDHRRVLHFVNRLRKCQADHPVVRAWSTKLSMQATELFQQASTAFNEGKLDVAVQRASASEKIWPIPVGRRAQFQNILNRFQRLRVGVLRFADEPAAYFLPTDADLRHRALTQAELFELHRNTSIPRFQTRYFEQWIPTDLGRTVEFTLRQERSYWESRPVLTAASVVEMLAARTQPDDPRYDERFASYVESMSVRSPYRFTIAFNRVPLRIEALFRFPVLAEDATEDGKLELLSRRFQLQSSDAGQRVYRRAVPEPADAPVFHIAEIVETRFDSHDRAVQALLRAQVDVLPRVQTWDVNAFKDDDRFYTQKHSVPVTHVLQVNPKTKALRNRELRRALALAIDRDRILTKVVLRDPTAEYGRLITAPYNSRSYAQDPGMPQRPYDLTLALSLSIAAKYAPIQPKLKELKEQINKLEPKNAKRVALEKQYQETKANARIPAFKMICPPDPVSEAAAREFVKHPYPKDFTNFTLFIYLLQTNLTPLIYLIKNKFHFI
ncbi:MAG: ABC transporter substrate-binding protein [Planctomycetaceae bacterium]